VLHGARLETVSATTARIDLVIADRPFDAADPSQWGNGLVVLGEWIGQGKDKGPTFVRLAAEPLAGHTSLSLSEPVAWEPGDQIIIGDTRQKYDGQTGTHWDRVRVASVSADGFTVHLQSPLLYRHPAVRDKAGAIVEYPHVALLTHNVVLRSENPAGVRGHFCWSKTGKVTLDNVEIRGLGRTTVATPSASNRKGRYPCHAHHVDYPATEDDRSRLTNCSVWCGMDGHPFRWGITLHDTHRARVSGNVVYNWTGWGIGTEAGTETQNEVVDNYIGRIRSSGDGANEDGRGWTTDIGFTGSALWFRAPDDIVDGNVSYDCSKGYVPVPRSANSTTRVHGTNLHPANLPIRSCESNEFWRVTIPFEPWGVGTTNTTPLPHQPWSYVRGMRAYHTNSRIMYGYRVANVIIENLIARQDWDVVRAGRQGTLGFFFSDYIAHEFYLRDSLISGFPLGYLADSFSTTQYVERVTFECHQAIRVETAWGLTPPPTRYIVFRNNVHVPFGFSVPSEYGPLAEVNLHARSDVQNTDPDSTTVLLIRGAQQWTLHKAGVTVVPADATLTLPGVLALAKVA
jgi:hypothetical protein